MHSIAGILIAGQSRRMGHPKPLIRIDGATLLERTAAIAAQVCDETILLGQPAFALPPAVAQLRLLPDTPPNIGPLGGLAALLAVAAPNPAILLACDLPSLDAPLLHKLLDEIDCSIDAVVFKTGADSSLLEPCCAAYMPSAARNVELQIESGHYALHELLARLRTRTITLSPADAARLANMNTPADVPTNDLK